MLGLTRVVPPQAPLPTEEAAVAPASPASKLPCLGRGGSSGVVAVATKSCFPSPLLPLPLFLLPRGRLLSSRPTVPFQIFFHASLDGFFLLDQGTKMKGKSFRVLPCSLNQRIILVVRVSLEIVYTSINQPGFLGYFLENEHLTIF